MMDTLRDPAPQAVIDSDALGVEGGDISLAALLDRHAAAEPITDDMIRRACLRTEPAQSTADGGRIDGESATQRIARLLRIAR